MIKLPTISYCHLLSKLNAILRIKNLFKETKSLRDKKRSSKRGRIREQAIVNYFTQDPLATQIIKLD